MPAMTKRESLLEQDEAWFPWLPLDYVTAKHVLVIAGMSFGFQLRGALFYLFGDIHFANKDEDIFTSR